MTKAKEKDGIVKYHVNKRVRHEVARRLIPLAKWTSSPFRSNY